MQLVIFIFLETRAQTMDLVGIINDLLSNGAVDLHHDLVDVQGGLDRMGLVVNPFELLEGAALGLDAFEGE